MMINNSKVDNEGQKTLQDAILQAVEDARQTCALNGSNSNQCAVAWDIVEELQAEKSHQQQQKKRPTYLDEYCFHNPDADECRVYDV